MPYHSQYKVHNGAKQCACCGQVKQLSEFTFTTAEHKWRKGTCRNCISKKTINTLHTRNINIPYNQSKKCSLYLGIFVAEQLLFTVFKNVTRMPMGNVGFDFICGKNFKIDVKSACLQQKYDWWSFHIRKNNIANYFACIAFDNRDLLNPLYFWLIPSMEIKHLVMLTIPINCTSKWQKYEKSIETLIEGCNLLKVVA